VRELVGDIRRLGPEIQCQSDETAKPHRMRTYTKCGRNSFRMRTYEIVGLKVV